MRGLFDAAFGFPAVLFSFGLAVVVGYWVLVLVGATDNELLDGGDVDAAAGDATDPQGLGGSLASVGLGGVPASVVVSVLIALAWLLSLTGGVIVERTPDWAPLRGALSVVVLSAAAVGAWMGTYALVAPLRRLLPGGPSASRTDFVGRMCVVRTGRVGRDFGQAEVTASDGSSALVQVRLAGDAIRSAGWTALLYDYDVDGEFFWITPIDQDPTDQERTF
jgi:hypothetical protein